MIKIAELRKLKGVTQRQLADACGVTQASISQVEAGKRSPSIELIEKIAGFFKVEKIALFENGYRDFLNFYISDLMKDLSIRSNERIAEYAELLRLSELQKGGLENLKEAVNYARGMFAVSPPMQGF